MPTSPSTSSRLVLPPVPAHLRAASVAGWREPVDIDTYDPLPPDRYPMFLERRVYQGSSGRVYPLPFHDRVSRHKRSRRWDAIHLVNKWLRIMVLPELGGRIHVGHDRTSGYDFFYRNNVIKPALVGLAGPWISGGVEFNWPQHHRPATFLPVAIELQTRDDGSVTVWCSDHDPFHRMKGMHGITLHPDRAVVELTARLHNRTEDVRTFLWWANAAVRVHDDYQSFFPPDVHTVADHARRATTGFPRATDRYYGIDYPARVTPEAPDADRIDWYRNIPVPTSYMCVGSHGDFFGGYDHRAQAGFVHWADHHVSPGKKQWTWGNDRFGQAWCQNLTDTDGPYVELMAGVYTDNQPDFSFLGPGETKVFNQYWYPIQRIGPVQQATREAALSVQIGESGEGGRIAALTLGVAVTQVCTGLSIRIEDSSGDARWSQLAEAAPGAPLVTQAHLDRPLAPADLSVVIAASGRQLLRWSPGDAQPNAMTVPPATEPPPPEQIPSTDELYLTGLHLAQYRHATRRPEPYWEEALRRDGHDSRSACALAGQAYERGDFDAAEGLLRRALRRSTALNANPYDGEAFYRLGLTLLRRGRESEAYDAFAKAAWNRAWCSPAQLSMARLRCAAGAWTDALALLDSALVLDAHNLAARDLRVLVLRRLGRTDQADRHLRETLDIDPLDWWARDLAGAPLTCDARTHLDVAAEYARSGFLADASRILDGAVERAQGEPCTGVRPLALYHRARVLDALGRGADAAAARTAAAAADHSYCFPAGLDDEQALRAALAADPDDGRTAGLLGHWLYDRRRYREAMAMWRHATRTDPGNAVCWRNLAIANFNVDGNGTAAVDCFQRAIQAGPDDSRLRYELDQLWKRVGEKPATRLAALCSRMDLVTARDDLTTEFASLLVQAGEPHQALQLLDARDFQPWEGGEGRVLTVWEQVQLTLARRSLAGGRFADAEAHARRAVDPPANLGEAPHPLVNRAELHLVLGDALAAQGRIDEARQSWTTSATFVGDFTDMSPQPYGDKTYFSALARRRLDQHETADRLLTGLAAYAGQLREKPAAIDYFATSLPALLLFQDDLGARQQTTAGFLAAQAAAGRGLVADAVDGLRDILARDPNHWGARELLRELLPATTEPPPADRTGSKPREGA
jgi:tetratricopeptide (TPR) repeat protein